MYASVNHSIMRRREIPAFTLKLSDLKEYEQAKQEKIDRKACQNDSSKQPKSAASQPARKLPTNVNSFN
uniref:Anaphase-promoting complex subunit CDC26 n=1 Tax=Anopheles stephensi TaxID=30069 RepID=A0A182YSR8_ANOST